MNQQDAIRTIAKFSIGMEKNNEIVICYSNKEETDLIHAVYTIGAKIVETVYLNTENGIRFTIQYFNC